MSSPFFVDFRQVRTIADLAVKLGCTEELLSEAIAVNKAGGLQEQAIEVTQEEYFDRRLYRRFHLDKKNPRSSEKPRELWSINNRALANAQKALLRRLHNFVSATTGFPAECVFGYVPGGSTLRNAARHCGARRLLHADIESFFPSITTGRVAVALVSCGLPHAGAQLVAGLTTIAGKLALGLNASPLVANLVCRELDRKMLLVAERYGCVYSRYADDLTFSSSDALPTRDEIADVMREEGFQLAQKKFSTSKRGQWHYVTGLSVSEDSPRVPKKMKRQLRQQLYFCRKYGIAGHLERRKIDLREGVNIIDGRIAYLKGIEPLLGDRLAAEWRSLLRRDGHVPIYRTRPDRAPHRVSMLFDESAIMTTQGRTFSLCCVTVEDPDDVRAQIDALLARCLSDPFTSGSTDGFAKLQRNGFHYADDSQDLRTELTKLVAVLPIRGFIAYVTPSAGPSAEEYVTALWTLLRDRYYAADGREVDIICEENPSVPLNAVEHCVERLYDALHSLGARRPAKRPKVIQQSKAGEHLLSLPDYLLGVFNDYARSREDDDRRSIKRMRFERLRDQIRFIDCMATRTGYSRKRPFEPWPNGLPPLRVKAGVTK